MAITDRGRLNLFANGWKNNLTGIRLLNSSSSDVSDLKTCSFNFNTTTKKLELTASVTFDIASGNDVAYVSVGRYTPPLGQYPALIDEYDRKGLSQIYNFATDGTLTINSLSFTLTSSYLTDLGREYLFTTGLQSKITFAKCCNVSNAVLDTQSTSFTATSTSFDVDAPIVFDIEAGKKPQYVHLGFNDGTDKFVYKRTHTEYNYPTAGTFTINGWSIKI